MKTLLKLSDEYVGHGIDDEGKEYEGYVIDGEVRFFYLNGEEVED